ncbi:hypothetical protein [Spiribacter roseus]|uniref:capsular polysaccharide export protein, LipB/KpsS family n=1 Tax=Spiribacter roseus TaxID=1855875 RepID=UPI00133046B6|nr:hypothetical protein [Spiribacter roseus]
MGATTRMQQGCIVTKCWIKRKELKQKYGATPMRIRRRAKTGIINKILNKPARSLAKRGNLSASDFLTAPSYEAQKNKKLIKECRVTINSLAKENKLEIIKQKRPGKLSGKAVTIVFPFSFFGPQNRSSRLGEQSTLTNFLIEALYSIETLGYKTYLIDDRNEAEKQTTEILRLSYHTYGKKPEVLHYKVADLPDYVVLDNCGYSGWSSLTSFEEEPLNKIASEDATEWYEEFKSLIFESKISKYEQNDTLDFKTPTNKYVFVALQMRGDSTQKLANVDMLDMLSMIAENFSDEDVEVVVKRHPLCTDTETAELLESLSSSGLITTSNQSIHSLIRSCEAVFTINSGVGSEALAYLKPVYVFGSCDYQFATHMITTKQDLYVHTHPIKLPKTELTIKKFLYYYRNIYLIDVKKEAAQVKIAQRIKEEAAAL